MSDTSSKNNENEFNEATDSTININTAWIGKVLSGEELPFEKKENAAAALLNPDSGKITYIDHYPFSIGRNGGDVQADLSLDNDHPVSHIHAHIEKKDGQDHIVNDHAMNGTFLNGKKLEDGVPAPLSKNDDIRLGNTKLIYMV